MKRFPMGWVVAGVVIAVWVLWFFSVVGIVVAIAATLVAAFVGAVFLDMTTRGSGKGIRDANRPEFYAPMTNQTWQVPTSYIDHPTGTGPPPGVEPYDEDALERVEGDREGRRPHAETSDQAP